MKKIIYTLLLATLSLFICTSCGTTTQEEKPAAQKETPKQTSKNDAEYERATKDLKGETVSRDTYEKDKKIILEKIDELNVIMESKNYKAWLSYIEPNSINYWSQKMNLTAASKQLPVKGLQLKTLEDYFNYMFIGSRKGRKIDEIRYISSKSIKAVQVRGDDVVIFYNFKKVNDEWLVELPQL